MDEEDATLDPSLYFLYAGPEGPAWDDLVGRTVMHAKIGEGRVERVKHTCGEPSMIYVRFQGKGHDGKEMKFRTAAFGDGFFAGMVVPDQLARRVQLDAEGKHAEELKRREREKRETEAKREFAMLRRKYYVDGHDEDPLVSPLYKILLLLEDDRALDDGDVAWLKDMHLSTVLAAVYERAYRREGDLWNLVKASSNWQDGDQYQRALDITAGESSSNAKLEGALLTTRGRAFRNLQDLDTAEQCARDAIALNPTRFHAYNLLGAIYYQRGYPQDGDEQFEKALELGASEKGMDSEIRAAVRIAHREQQREVARFLLAKDPDKYQWATQYL